MFLFIFTGASILFYPSMGASIPPSVLLSILKKLNSAQTHADKDPFVSHAYDTFPSWHDTNVYIQIHYQYKNIQNVCNL